MSQEGMIDHEKHENKKESQFRTVSYWGLCAWIFNDLSASVASGKFLQK